MLLQELYDAAYKGLASQNFERSVDQTGQCSYRTNNGKKCAIGWLIPDELYSPDFEGCNLDDAAVLAAVRPAVVDGSEEYKMLFALQSGHDAAYDKGEMKSSLAFVAEYWKLTIPTDVR
jgi:hypothetical protein